MIDMTIQEVIALCQQAYAEGYAVGTAKSRYSDLRPEALARDVAASNDAP